MIIIIAQKLFHKIGFYQTLEVLETKPISYRKFHKALSNIKSYYNAFYRVKEDMIKKGLIEIYRDHNKRELIKLTDRGNRCKLMLLAVSELIS